MFTSQSKKSLESTSSADREGGNAGNLSAGAVQQNKVIQQMAKEEEEPLQGKFVVQKKGLEEEELPPIQGKFAAAEHVQDQSQPAAQCSSQISTVQKKVNQTGLPDHLKEGVENLSGIAMDDVKVHYNSDKPAQLQALAYAQGTDIHVGPGQEKHLPHEAWHVVQQKQGRVQPTMQMKGSVAVNDDKGLENEADVMGEKAIQLKDGLNSKHIDLVQHSNSIIKNTIQYKLFIGKEPKAINIDDESFKLIQTTYPEVLNEITEMITSEGINYGYSTIELAVKSCKKHLEVASASAAVMPASGGPPPPPPPPPPMPLVPVGQVVTAKDREHYNQCIINGRKKFAVLLANREPSVDEMEKKERSKRYFDEIYVTKRGKDQNMWETDLIGDLGGKFNNSIENKKIGAKENANESKNNLLPNSDILFYQYRNEFKGQELEELWRINVASGSGTAVVAVLTEKYGKESVALADESDEFFAVLGTENGVPAMFLIHDHGEDLGITGIKSVRADLIANNFIIEFKKTQ